MKSRLLAVPVVSCGVLVAAFSACGGSPSNPTPSPSPITIASPSPSPSPSATPDPRAGLPPGPVTQARIAIRSIDTGGFNYRNPVQDADGNWVVRTGEFVVFDLSQRNGAGEKCAWIDNPEWHIDDDAGVLSVRGSSNPFLLRVDVERRGFVELSATVDGIDTNIIALVAER